MSERTMEKARQVVHRLSEWYFAEGGDNDPDSPIDREDLDALHDLVRTPSGEGEADAEGLEMLYDIRNPRGNLLRTLLHWRKTHPGQPIRLAENELDMVIAALRSAPTGDPEREVGSDG